ncbi:acyl-CoA carboxylase subunit epsilon, partial [Streptomyces sp. NPDC046316]|uniref:acyl-CoA carboxylase subunit epsilon n=1 Tax=Streptomyces sp. NPDC046316 TaxID=3154494 RepID=UPI0033C1593E
MTTPATANLLRVEKGHADPEELAAITAVLLARAAAQPAELRAHPEHEERGTDAHPHRDRSDAARRGPGGPGGAPP